MTNSTRTLLAATALGLGLAAAPASAQVGYDRGAGYANRADVDGARRPVGYDEFGSLNVFGARIDPRGTQGGLVGGIGNTVGGVVGGVGTAVGGVVGGVAGAADDVVTGSIGGRDDYAPARRGNVGRYGRASGSPAASY